MFVGTEWFKQVMRDDDLQGRAAGQITFSLAVLAVEIPLGILLACPMPAKGWKVGGAGGRGDPAADPVERGRHHLADLTAAPTSACSARRSTGSASTQQFTGNATHAWLTVLVMDVWHWTPLVALLALLACFHSGRVLPGCAH